MSIKVMSAVWEGSPYDGGKLLLHLALADRADDEGVCWPSIPTLAKKIRVSDRHVQRMMREMEDDGQLVTVLGGHEYTNSNVKTNYFVITIGKTTNEISDTLWRYAKKDMEIRGDIQTTPGGDIQTTSRWSTDHPSGDIQTTPLVTSMSPNTSLIHQESIITPGVVTDASDEPGGWEAIPDWEEVNVTGPQNPESRQGSSDFDEPVYVDGDVFSPTSAVKPKVNLHPRTLFQERILLAAGGKRKFTTEDDLNRVIALESQMQDALESRDIVFPHPDWVDKMIDWAHQKNKNGATIGVRGILTAVYNQERFNDWAIEKRNKLKRGGHANNPNSNRR